MLFMLILDWMIFIYILYIIICLIFSISVKDVIICSVYIYYIYTYTYTIHIYVCVKLLGIQGNRKVEAEIWSAFLLLLLYFPLVMLEKCDLSWEWWEESKLFFFFDQLKFCSLAKKKGDIRTRYKMSQCSLNSHWRVNF